MPQPSRLVLRGSDELEAFLKDVERELISQVLDKGRFIFNETFKSKEVKEMRKNLDGKDFVVIPTDKTNSYRTVKTNDYKRWVIKHLEKSAAEIPRSKLVEVHQNAMEYLEELEPLLSKNEHLAIRESITSKAVPTPKLLIKDHKPADEHGNFPTRLVVPATNFTAAFPKVGYLGIKKIFDDNNICYDRRTIIQASDLKGKLESLGLQRDEVTILSIDIVAFYPSIKYKLVREAVHYFAARLDPDLEEKIENCLEMIKFGMGATLLTFVDKYYEYDGSCDIEEKGLTIGGYESAWLADLVASYILETTTEQFVDMKYHGFYRDDGFGVFTQRLMKQDVIQWRNKFQEEVNRIAGNDFVQFTAVVWGADREDGSISEEVTVEKSDRFPYLDMELCWSPEGELIFGVHLKPNQALKYLNAESSHTASVFKAVPHGVIDRLAKLTTITDSNKDATIDEIYPHHATALKAAGLSPEKYPTIKSIQDSKQINAEARKRAKEKKRKNRNRSVFFCIGHSKGWESPIHVTLKRLRNKHNLKWLRISMSYHRFPNFREMLQGDLSRKLRDGVESLDFKDKKCNCRPGMIEHGMCPYRGNCLKMIVVYKVTCKCCNMIYIGNTQQRFKKRMEKHFNDVQKLVFKDIRSDSYARHFATHFKKGSKPKPKELREIQQFEIIWQGEPLTTIKTFATRGCILCTRERIAIIKAGRKEPEKLINTCSEIYGACRHKPWFHRYQEEGKTISTDDPEKGERVNCTEKEIDENDPNMNVVKDVPAGLCLPCTSSDTHGSQPSRQKSPKAAQNSAVEYV